MRQKLSTDSIPINSSYVDISCSSISNLSFLSKFTHIVTLDASRTQVANLKNVNEILSLSNVKIAATPFSRSKHYRLMLLIALNLKLSKIDDITVSTNEKKLAASMRDSLRKYLYDGWVIIKLHPTTIKKDGVIKEVKPDSNSSSNRVKRKITNPASKKNVFDDSPVPSPSFDNDKPKRRLCPIFDFRNKPLVSTLALNSNNNANITKTTKTNSGSPNSNNSDNSIKSKPSKSSTPKHQKKKEIENEETKAIRNKLLAIINDSSNDSSNNLNDSNSQNYKEGLINYNATKSNNTINSSNLSNSLDLDIIKFDINPALNLTPDSIGSTEVSSISENSPSNRNSSPLKGTSSGTIDSSSPKLNEELDTLISKEPNIIPNFTENISNDSFSPNTLLFKEKLSPDSALIEKSNDTKNDISDNKKEPSSIQNFPSNSSSSSSDDVNDSYLISKTQTQKAKNALNSKKNNMIKKKDTNEPKYNDEDETQNIKKHLKQNNSSKKIDFSANSDLIDLNSIIEIPADDGLKQANNGNENIKSNRDTIESISETQARHSITQENPSINPNNQLPHKHEKKDSLIREKDNIENENIVNKESKYESKHHNQNSKEHNTYINASNNRKIKTKKIEPKNNLENDFALSPSKSIDNIPISVDKKSKIKIPPFKSVGQLPKPKPSNSKNKQKLSNKNRINNFKQTNKSINNKVRGSKKRLINNYSDISIDMKYFVEEEEEDKNEDNNYDDYVVVSEKVPESLNLFSQWRRKNLQKFSRQISDDENIIEKEVESNHNNEISIPKPNIQKKNIVNKKEAVSRFYNQPNKLRVKERMEKIRKTVHEEQSIKELNDYSETNSNSSDSENDNDDSNGISKLKNDRDEYNFEKQNYDFHNEKKNTKDENNQKIHVNLNNLKSIVHPINSQNNEENSSKKDSSDDEYKNALIDDVNQLDMLHLPSESAQIDEFLELEEYVQNATTSAAPLQDSENSNSENDHVEKEEEEEESFDCEEDQKTPDKTSSEEENTETRNTNGLNNINNKHNTKQTKSKKEIVLSPSQVSNDEDGDLSDISKPLDLDSSNYNIHETDTQDEGFDDQSETKKDKKITFVDIETDEFEDMDDNKIFMPSDFLNDFEPPIKLSEAYRIEEEEEEDDDEEDNFIESYKKKRGVQKIHFPNQNKSENHLPNKRNIPIRKFHKKRK